ARIAPASGTYTPEVQAAIDKKTQELQARGISPDSKAGKRELQSVGQVGTTRHSHGKALDFDVIDPQGNKVTDRSVLQSLAEEFGRQGVSSLGYGENYMGTGRFH